MSQDRSLDVMRRALIAHLILISRLSSGCSVICIVHHLANKRIVIDMVDTMYHHGPFMFEHLRSSKLCVAIDIAIVCGNMNEAYRGRLNRPSGGS